MQKNGKRIKKGSITNYENLERLLIDFSNEKDFRIRIKVIEKFKKSQFEEEKKYWKEFYFSFTSYLFNDLGNFDNYVGRTIKLLRSFFNYLINEKGMNIGFHHRKFYAPSEDVEIVVLSPERLSVIVNDQEVDKNLSSALRMTKDVFVVGCTVALRFSDLMALTKTNIERINERIYLRVYSQKTQAFTRVKLPNYVVAIFNKYTVHYKHRLLPKFTKANLNKKLKILMEIYGFTEEVPRFRLRQGLRVQVYKNTELKTHYRFCDSVTTHTLRRTAITTMLSLGMNEQTVRQISGHAANSKEFYRYVAFAQTYLDKQVDQVHQKLAEKSQDYDRKIA